MPTVILVADDFALFREMVSRTLGARSDQIVKQAADGSEAVQKAQEFQPDVVLLDVGLPKLDGIEAARRIRIVSPNSKIIFVSLQNSPDIIEECLRLGRGYISKIDADRELPEAIDVVLQGKRFVGAGLV